MIAQTFIAMIAVIAQIIAGTDVAKPSIPYYLRYFTLRAAESIMNVLIYLLLDYLFILRRELLFILFYFLLN
jgi:hypothetical protein